MITAKGSHVTIDLNGTRIIDRDDPKFDKEGIIALQIHVWPEPMEVRFKDIEIKELDSVSRCRSQRAIDDPCASMYESWSLPVRRGLANSRNRAVMPAVHGDRPEHLRIWCVKESGEPLDEPDHE